MSRDLAYLLDILIYAKDAREFTTAIDKTTFFSDHQCQLAVIRCLEVMGEAVKRLSLEIQKVHPEISWSNMAKMRDLLIHAYDRVDLEEIWNTVKSDLPPLIAALEQILPPEQE
jgi:uncharacterized protein with HEPN domain